MEVENEFVGYHVDLVKERRKSRLYVWALTLVAGLALVMLLTIPGMVKGSLEKSVFISSGGDVMEIGMANRSESMQVEILGNLDYWFDTYYSYNQANVDEQRELGLYLCSNATSIYLEEKWAPWVVDVKSQGLIQRTVLDPESVQVSGLNGDGFHFVAVGRMDVRNDDFINKYNVKIESDVSFVDRTFPRNRYGMQFYNYTEVVEQTEVNAKIR